jgi:uncharacterized protein YjbI with pentapeptide repeats
MPRTGRARPQKVGPDAPDVPDDREPAPAALESGAVWDCVDADAGVSVPEDVYDCTMQESRWVGADLRERRFAGLRCRDTQFERCDLSGAVLDEAVLTRVTFTNCRLSGLVLSGAELADVRISDSRADLASLRMARGKYLLVENTSLHAADFYEFAGTECALLGCELTGANFQDSRLTGMRLHGSTLDDIRGALSLRGARIGSDQLVPLGVAMLDALEIRVTDGPAS